MVLTLATQGNEAWGRQRFWGSASWGLGSLFVGALIDRVGLEAGIFGSTYMVCAALLCLLFFRVRPRWPASESDVEYRIAEHGRHRGGGRAKRQHEIRL